MKKKEKLNYMLRAVYNNENYSMKDLESYCIEHRVAADRDEFQALLKVLLDKGCIWVDLDKAEVLFRKPLSKEGISAGVCYSGTKKRIYFDPGRTWIQPMI